MHKTCWYTTIHPLRVGAIVGSGGTAELAPLVRFGFHFGAAFQIRDDLLNLVGDEQTYGKEILGDLYEGKRTLPLVHLIGRSRRVPTATWFATICAAAGRSVAGTGPQRPRADGRLRQHRRSPASTPRAFCWSPRSTSSRPSPTPSPAPDLDFLRSLVPYVWARWRYRPASSHSWRSASSAGCD